MNLGAGLNESTTTSAMDGQEWNACIQPCGPGMQCGPVLHLCLSTLNDYSVGHPLVVALQHTAFGLETEVTGKQTIMKGDVRMSSNLEILL